MPYKLKGNCVVMEDTNETVKCHDTKEEAEAHLKALYANIDEAHKMTEDSFSFFLPLQKVVEQDDGTCLVFTRGAQEIPDVSGEIFDYDSSVPRLQKWSEAAYRRSNGLSYGNVRAMHGKQAAGKLEAPISYNTKEKAVDLVVKVVDPVDVKKCREGVYTGMSIGGRYAKRWPDPKFPGYMRYTADPLEFSLVDMPNIPTATFELVKTDGTAELAKFAGAVEDEDCLDDIVPTADKVPKADVSGGEYLEKDNVDTVDKAPDPLKHGVDPMKVKAEQVPERLENVVEDLKKAIERIEGRDKEEFERRDLLLKDVGERVGIGRRKDSPALPPLGYPVDETEYADPANWSWRYDIGEFARAAVTQYNLRKSRNNYTDREWNILGRRIAYRATILLDSPHKYDPVSKRIEKETSVAELNKAALDEVVGKLRAAAGKAIEQVNDPHKVLDALHQIVAAIDVVGDDVKDVPAPTKPETLQAGAGMPEAAPESTPASEKTPPPTMKKDPTPAPTPPPPSEPSMQKNESQMSQVTETVEKLAKIVAEQQKLLDKLLATPPKPGLLTKNVPLNDMQGLPTQQLGEELTPLQKSILSAAGQVKEGVNIGTIRGVMEAANGDAKLARETAMDMVRKSLTERGFTSSSKIRTISPAMAAQIRQKLSNE